MEIRDRLSLASRGTLVIRCYRGDELVIDEIHENLVVSGMRRTICQLLGEGAGGCVVTKIGIGTGSAAAHIADANLTNGYLRTLLSVDYPQPGQVRFTWAIDSGEANGLAIREFGLFTADNTLVARRVRASAIEKTSALRLTGSWLLQL